MHPPTVGLDWSVIIPLIFAGIVQLIAAWNSVKAKQESRATKTAVEVNATNGAQAGAERDAKLDNITILVNGRYSLVLQELADVKRLLAAETGREIDRVAATVAQQTADEQAARVVAPAPVKES